MSDEDEYVDWPSKLYKLLTSSEYEDEDIVEFVEENASKKENKIFDYKSDLYLSHSDPEMKNNLKGKFIKLICALCNNLYSNKNRYIFVGFNNDTGEFEGCKYRSPRGKKHVLEVDESHIQNLINNYIEPSPEVECFDISIGEKEGFIFRIKKMEKPPAMINQGLKISEGKKSIISKGQTYTRRGSKVKLMESSDIRKYIQRREELFNDKLQDIAENLSDLVKLSTEEIEDIGLQVTHSSVGLPIKEYITTQKTTDVNQKLKTCVKNWNSTGELLSNRKTIYEFYNQRRELELSDEKCEFLIRSCLVNWQVGTEWILKHNNPIKLFKEIVEEEQKEPTILMLEKILMIINKRKILKEIKENHEYSRSKAEDFIDISGNPIEDKLESDKLTLFIYSRNGSNQKRYKVNQLLYNSSLIKEVLQNNIQWCLDTDDSRARQSLRGIELVRLGSEGKI